MRRRPDPDETDTGSGSGTRPLVTLAAAGVRRGARWLVRDVSLHVGAGEIVTLLGPNGSGKSTTARLALGVLGADEGSVHRRSGLRIAYVPQRLSIDWTLPLTVARFMRLTQRVAPGAAAAALEETGVAHLAGAQMRDLSGGEFQRVLIARAMARGGELMVLDEPVQGVDMSGMSALYDLVRRHRDRTGCGVLMVSHDLHLVMAATDRVICLNGHVCCSGTPQAVAGTAAFRDLFGSAAAGLAVYAHEHDHTHLPDGRVRHADGSVTDHCHDGDGHHDHDHAAAGEGRGDHA